jgi:hypothetical protein
MSSNNIVVAHLQRFQGTTSLHLPLSPIDRGALNAFSHAASMLFTCPPCRPLYVLKSFIQLILPESSSLRLRLYRPRRPLLRPSRSPPSHNRGRATCRSPAGLARRRMDCCKNGRMDRVDMRGYDDSNALFISCLCIASAFWHGVCHDGWQSGKGMQAWMPPCGSVVEIIGGTDNVVRKLVTIL